VDSVNAIRVPQDYVTQREPLRQSNGALGVLSQQLQNAKMQADASRSALKQGDDLKPVFDKVYEKVVTKPSEALQPLIPAAQIFTQQLVQVGDFIAQQDTQVSFVANGIQFPTSQQASQYNTLIGPLASQHQAFSQAGVPQSLPQNKPKKPLRRGFFMLSKITLVILYHIGITIPVGLLHRPKAV
jgi:hypothetical protein